jgi:hypothetical protein
MRKVVALVAVVGGLGAAFYSQLPEVRRYIKIERM